MKRKGPAPTEQGQQIVVRCRTVLLGEIDDWRRQQDDLPTRPEAIRRLVQKALKGA